MRWSKTKQSLHQASHAERTKWIDELKQMLRNGRTKSAMSIDPQPAHEIAKRITILNEGIARPETPESIKQMRASMAPFLANLDGRRKKSSKDRGQLVTKTPKYSHTRKAKGRSR